MKFLDYPSSFFSSLFLYRLSFAFDNKKKRRVFRDYVKNLFSSATIENSFHGCRNSRQSFPARKTSV